MVSLKIPAQLLFPTSASCIAAYHELATTTIQAAILSREHRASSSLQPLQLNTCSPNISLC